MHHTYNDDATHGHCIACIRRHCSTQAGAQIFNVINARSVSTHIPGHQHSPPSISTACGLSIRIVCATRRSAGPTLLVLSPPSALILASFCPGIPALTVVAHPDPGHPFRLAAFVSSTRDPLVVIGCATRGVSAWRPWHSSGVIPILRARFHPATVWCLHALCGQMRRSVPIVQAQEPRSRTRAAHLELVESGTIDVQSTSLDDCDLQSQPRRINPCWPSSTY